MLLDNLNTKTLEEYTKDCNNIINKLEDCPFSGKPISRENLTESEMDFLYVTLSRLLPDLEFELEERKES
jgi:hypothetical protein